MAEQILDVLIKVAKLGDGDEKLIAGLQRMKTEAATGAAPALEKTGAEGEKAAKSLGGLEVVTSRFGDRILSATGINREFATALKGLELSAKGAAGGLSVASAASAGLGAVILASIAGASKLAADLDAASTAEVDSAKAAGAAENARAKALEAVGLSAKATKKEILAFADSQREVIKNFAAFETEGGKMLRFMEQSQRLSSIERKGAAEIAALKLERQGIGAEGPDQKAAAQKAGLAAGEAAQQSNITDLINKKNSVLENLEDLEAEHADLKEADDPKEFARQAALIEKQKEQLDALRNQIQAEETELEILKKINAERRINIDLQIQSEKAQAAQEEEQAIAGMEFAAAEKTEMEAKASKKSAAQDALREVAAQQKAKIDAMTFGRAGAAPSNFIGIRGPAAGTPGFTGIGEQKRGPGFVGLGGAPAGLQTIGVKKEDVAGAAQKTGKSVGEELKSALAGFPDDVVAGLAPEIDKLTKELAADMQKKFGEWVKNNRG